ncbi:MAG: cytochrome c [Acidobacteriota bacterium]
MNFFRHLSFKAVALLLAGLLFSALSGSPTIALGPAEAARGDAGEPTFHANVERIFQAHCQSCHREGGANYGGMVAPMPLLTYDQVRPWARSIVRQVEARAMPPWHASDAQDGHFANERGLSEEEIATIARWVELGARRGDPASAPSPVDWPDLGGWTIGEPDLVIEMPERTLVADDVEDDYRYFRHTLTPEQLPKDRWIKAFEFRPGSSAVHHIILNPIGGIAPGTGATVYREGIGRRLAAGARLTWEMHYHKEPGEGTAVWDRSRVALKFYDEGEEVPFPIRDAEMGNYRFEIPAGASHYSVQSKHRFREDAKILSFAPHMHLRGKAVSYEARLPTGESRMLLEVPQYDFNWQTTYRYREPLEVPAGTQLIVTTTWDNSSANPNNPDPTVAVRYGEPTTDEMSFGFVEYVGAEPRRRGRGRRAGRSGSTNVWENRELGLRYEVPARLQETETTDGLVAFAGPMELPHVEISSDLVGFSLSDDDLAALLQEGFVEFDPGAEVRSVAELSLSEEVSAREVLVDWSMSGLPLTSLVAAVEKDGHLITAMVTHQRSVEVERLRWLARRLSVTFD